MAVGILAYGSLVDDPGDELGHCVTRRIDDVETPFAVEFARSSRTRCGAPTLVPVAADGAPVRASVLVLDDGVDAEDGRDMLFRRETRRVGQPVRYRDSSGQWIATIPQFLGLSACLYTALESNIDPLTVSVLAELAIESARSPAGAHKRDGISYLDEQKGRGVVTPLMPGYEAEVLTRTGGEELRDSWELVRGTRFAG